MAGKKVKVAIVGPGNIGTDLMYKVFRSQYLEMSLMLGVVESEGIKRARNKGVEVSRRASTIWCSIGKGGHRL